MVKEKLVVTTEQKEEIFNDPEKKKFLSVINGFVIIVVTKLLKKNDTLDHLIPQCKGGGHNKNNLKTCCLVCNAIKSGKHTEEAAPFC